MDFAEANEAISEMQSTAGYRSQGDVDRIEYSCLDVHYILNDIEDILDRLKEQYAPTVEMTKKQFHSFELWKNHTPGWNMTNCAEFARDENMKANDAMNAWLHPECIKVID